MCNHSMYFIHCSDLHLDSPVEAHLNPHQAQLRRQELLGTFARLADYAEEHHITAIMISGDLFDSDPVSSSAVQYVLHTAQKHPSVDFLYLPGNHDVSAIHCLERAGYTDNFYIVGNYPSIDNPHVILQKTYGSVVITGLSGPIEQLPSLLADCTNLVMVHGQISSNPTVPSAENGELHYCSRDFSGKHIDYIAAGHIHQFRIIPIDRRCTFCYSGCLEGRGFDECGEKGFVLLTVTPEGAVAPQFTPFALRTIRKLDADITGCTDYAQIETMVTDILADAKPSDLVRLCLSGTVPPDLNLHINWLTHTFYSNFYFLLIEDHTKPAVSYKDYQFDISLKGEFIRLVLSSDNLTESEKAEIIKEGLQALSGEEITIY